MTESNTSPPIRALVTGGSGGIGAAIAKRLAADGYAVLVHAHRNLSAAQSVVDQIRGAGGQAEAVEFDLTDGAATRAVIANLVDQDAIQVLVNNAGIHDDAAFPALSEKQWDSVIDVSLNGFFHVTQALIMPMIRKRWGRIINLSSVAAITGNRGQVNYSAAKGAINAATKALAIELASRGVTVNAIAPGIIATAMTENAFDPEIVTRMVPMKRAGSADEVASLVSFLASHESSYITGQIISINGGMI